MQSQQTKTDFFCEFNRGCAAMCSLCPHRGSGRDEETVTLTKNELIALNDGAFGFSSSHSRMFYNSAFQKFEQAYKRIRSK